MKKSNEIRTFRCCIMLLLTLTSNLSLIAQERTSKYFFGIEFNNELCGYSEVFLNENGEKNYIEIIQKAYISIRAMGRDIIQKQAFTYHLDPTTGNFNYHVSSMEDGVNMRSAKMTLSGDTLYIESSSGKGLEKVYIPANTVLPNTLFYPHLKESFVIKGIQSMTYQCFNVSNGKVQEFEYTKVGSEDMEFNNRKYHAVIISENDPDTGLKTKYWIDTESGLRLKTESQNNISIYLTDLTVVSKVKQGSWDDVIFIKTNVDIKDIRGITSMQVKASLEGIPASSPDDLNVNGQIFEGEVSDNMINGIFKIAHAKYNGNNAPKIGDFDNASDKIAMYLSAEEMIESDDSSIASIAKEVSSDAQNSWEIVKRLGYWINNNIKGSIYGGSAHETFVRGDGACGPQSLLMAALCRAAGIPSRVVWGCMYTPVEGGSFGHHAWNEVFMGAAGWIPIDVTSKETDYVDSGHIRLGILKTKVTVINFREMEILDYSVK